MLGYIQTWANISRKIKYYNTVQGRNFDDKNKYLIGNSPFCHPNVGNVSADYTGISKSFRFTEWNYINGKRDYTTR